MDNPLGWKKDLGIAMIAAFGTMLAVQGAELIGHACKDLYKKYINSSEEDKGDETKELGSTSPWSEDLVKLRERIYKEIRGE